MSRPAVASVVALRIRLEGRVQGIGLRPAVARWAEQTGVRGFVRNALDGAEIHVEGRAEAVESFRQGLHERLPPAARVDSLDVESAAPRGCDRFSIVAVERRLPAAETGHASAAAAVATVVPVDASTCAACLAEAAKPADRRLGYPLISCAECGPRYSILDAMPFERAETAMRAFPLCPRCEAEYASPAERRFHAQTTTCPACGPRVWLTDAGGAPIARGADTFRAAAHLLGEGKIVAVRGIGGYQLMADARSAAAVARLRDRKRRRAKPLAVMVADRAAAQRLAILDETERRWLSDSSAPIVVVRRRGEADLAAGISAGLATVGLMLPTSALHHQLLAAAGGPLVCTSGNREGEPIEYLPPTDASPLRAIADAFLEHDRPIRRPVDDSVVRVIAGRAVTLRLARGLAPRTLDLPDTPPAVALGGHLKNAIALANGRQAVLGPHVGDLSGLAAGQRFREQTDALCDLFGVRDPRWICDQHPDYFSTAEARRRAPRPIPIQHHHAHIAATMLEHGGIRAPVFGVALDGTGWGNDGTVWGGECLIVTRRGFERVAHLRTFPLLGGEAAVREPWRVAAALVEEAAGRSAAAALRFASHPVAPLLTLLDRPHLWPRTSSAGRLFDAVACLALGIEHSEFEGQAATQLEDACDRDEPGAYPLPLREGRPAVLDWRPLIAAVLDDRSRGHSPGVISARFHRGLAEAIAEIAARQAIGPVAFGGGVFQNKVLVEGLIQALGRRDRQGLFPAVIPPNDGGLAAGQLAAAAWQEESACASGSPDA